MLNKKKIAIIGSGFSGLSAAIDLASYGYDVHVFEKNNEIGGRARKFSAEGFTFDMGPSWYWMPDVMERFFQKHNHTSSDFFKLIELDPGFKMIFSKEEAISIPSNWHELLELFEKLEKGSSRRLESFMEEAEFKYKISMKDLVYKPGLSLLEFVRKDIIQSVFKLQLFSSFSKHVRKYFKDPRLLALMEFPVLFLGAMPKDTPALYSLMNYSGLKQGTFYPIGGFSELVDAFKKIADEKGVTFHCNAAVEKIEVHADLVTRLKVNNKFHSFEAVIASADYHHVEQTLLPKEYRNYNSNYWEKKTFAPSSLIFYLGVNVKVNNLEHHNLFFDEDLNQHAIEIYKDKKWPTKPLFYVCCPSKTDSKVAPEGKENLFVLMPLATGIEDSELMREKYYNLIMDRLEKHTKSKIKDNIIYRKSYCIKDFKEDYNAYKGNAYGLANTLKQTAFLKPKIINKKIKNLFYTGQLTVPGPGVPPSIISGQIVASHVQKKLKD